MGPQLQTVDRQDLLDTLADDACRETVSSLEASDNSVTTLDELSARTRTDSATDATPVAAALHHVVLPKLAATGILEYDASTHTVHYDGQERVKAVVNTIERMGQ